MGMERVALLDPAEGLRTKRVEVQPVPSSFHPRYDAGKPGRKDLSGDACGTATPGGFSPTTERGTEGSCRKAPSPYIAWLYGPSSTQGDSTAASPRAGTGGWCLRISAPKGGANADPARAGGRAGKLPPSR